MRSSNNNTEALWCSSFVERPTGFQLSDIEWHFCHIFHIDYSEYFYIIKEDGTVGLSFQKVYIYSIRQVMLRHDSWGNLPRDKFSEDKTWIFEKLVENVEACEYVIWCFTLKFPRVSNSLDSFFRFNNIPILSKLQQKLVQYSAAKSLIISTTNINISLVKIKANDYEEG